MTTSIDLLEFLVTRPGMACPMLNSNGDLLAAIHGICIGVGESPGATRFGTLPKFVLKKTPHPVSDSWLDSFQLMFAGKSLIEALIIVEQVIAGWKSTHPTLLIPLPERSRNNTSIDWETFYLIENVFRQPWQYYADLSTIRQVLCFVHCYLTSRWPPHGHTFGIEELSRYASKKREILTIPFEGLVFKEFSKLPFGEACLAVADLIRDWRESYL